MKLANDRFFFSIFQTCHDKNKFVFEVSHIFGDTLTPEELEYWICYNIISRAIYFEIDYRAFPLDEVIKDIETKEAERKAKYAKAAAK